jgi:cytochrome c biogenesis protein ResB
VPEPFYHSAHNRTTLPSVPPEAAVGALRGMRFRTEVTSAAPDATYVFADRFAWAQLGTFVSHLAIILFLAGGLVSWLTGFGTSMFAGEGTTMPVFAVSDPGQLQIRVDDAVGRYGDAGNPLDFRTHLTVFRNGEEVASGYTTVNDPLHYGGYRFHQVGYFPDGAALRVRDEATGNTLFRETFPLEETTAAPRVTVTDAAGRVLLQDVIAPTDFLPAASGSLTALTEADRVVWLGITPGDGQAWQLVGYDPQAPVDARQLRLAEGDTGEIDGLRVRFDDVESIPSAVGLGVPGTDTPLLAQLTHDAAGRPALLLVGQGRPAIALAEGAPVVVDGYEYTFEGAREFAGISVRRDRGAWFIWVATAMLLIGLAITFYVPRRRLWLKITPGGTRIAALAEKSGGFETDMRTLATRLGVPVPPELQEEA